MCETNVVGPKTILFILMAKTHCLIRHSLFAGMLSVLLFPALTAAQQVPVAPVETPQQTQQPEPNRPAQPTTPQNEAKPNVQGTGPGAPVDSTSYKVGPADILNIRVWDEPQFSGPVSVQQNGNITLPLVGDLKAGGKTPVQIEDEITKTLTKYIVRPLVTVTVQEVGSRRYYMVGQIGHAGEYPLVVPTTILEAISKAGGPLEFANTKKIYVLRGDKRIPFNWKEVLKGKHMDQNIQLQPGDTIVIP